MSMSQLLLVLRSRIWLVVAIAASTIAAGVVFTFGQDKQYLATSSMLLNFATENPYDDSGVSPQLADSYIATQVEVITSRNVMQQVIEDLALADTPAGREDWMAIFQQNLDVEAGRESRVIAINYQAGNPARAADIANAFAHAYVGAIQQMAVNPAKRNAKWFDSQLAQMRTKLGKAQSRLTRFQQDEGIVAMDEDLDTETTRLNELNEQLLTAQSEMYDARSRQLGVNHPEYVRSVRRLESVKESLQEQKQKVLSLKQQRDELEVLAREVNVEKNAYERALQSYYDEQLRSTMGQTRVEVLDEAVPPSEPSSPNVPLNIVGSVLLGLTLAGLFAVIAELMFRKIRTAEDISDFLDTRMLTSV